jgi:hypothetical protein
MVERRSRGLRPRDLSPPYWLEGGESDAGELVQRDLAVGVGVRAGEGVEADARRQGLQVVVEAGGRRGR